MTTLYLGSAHDAPHSQHPYMPATTACGKPMVGLQEITATQALVYLSDRRCKDCAHHLDRIARGNR